MRRQLNLDGSSWVEGATLRFERTQVDLWAQCQTLLDVAVATREHRTDWLDVILRRGALALQSLGL
jgi:hypothetical protein